MTLNPFVSASTQVALPLSATSSTVSPLQQRAHEFSRAFSGSRQGSRFSRLSSMASIPLSERPSLSMGAATPEDHPHHQHGQGSPPPASSSSPASSPCRPSAWTAGRTFPLAAIGGSGDGEGGRAMAESRGRSDGDGGDGEVAHAAQGHHSGLGSASSAATTWSPSVPHSRLPSARVEVSAAVMAAVHAAAAASAKSTNTLGSGAGGGRGRMSRARQAPASAAQVWMRVALRGQQAA